MYKMPTQNHTGQLFNYRLWVSQVETKSFMELDSICLALQKLIFNLNQDIEIKAYEIIQPLYSWSLNVYHPGDSTISQLDDYFQLILYNYRKYIKYIPMHGCTFKFLQKTAVRSYFSITCFVQYLYTYAGSSWHVVFIPRLLANSVIFLIEPVPQLSLQSFTGSKQLIHERAWNMRWQTENNRKGIVSHDLMINDSKTEFLIIGSHGQLSKKNINSITVDDSSIEPVKSVINLGSWFDEHMAMDIHIRNISSKAFKGLSSFQLRLLKFQFRPL